MTQAPQRDTVTTRRSVLAAGIRIKNGSVVAGPAPRLVPAQAVNAVGGKVALA